MNSEELRKVAKEILGPYVSDDFPFADVAQRLTELEEANSMTLSPYGYIMWAVDHYGYKCAHKNCLASDKVLQGYAADALKTRDDMPAMLMNAHVYVTKVMSNVADMGMCFRQLEGMTFPYILYILFAGSGKQSVVAGYREKAKEHLRRYPSALDLLPDAYKALASELGDSNADAEQC